MPSFSRTLEIAVHAALEFANARRHEFTTLEHLLLALIDEPDASRVMKACSVDLDRLQETLIDFIDEGLANLVVDYEGNESVPTAAFQRVIQRAAIHIQSSGRTEVTGANVIVAMFAERESKAAIFLHEQDMTRYDAVNFIAHGVAKDPAYNEFRQVEEIEGDWDEEPADEEERLTEAEWRARYMPIETQSSSERDGKIESETKTRKKVISSGPFVFLSYAHLDQEIVTNFLPFIHSKNIRTWWDQDISPGDEWRSEIADKLEKSNVILTFWTESSTVSTSVIEEASTAQSKKKLVHVRMDDSTIPYGFSETQYVDLRAWDGTESDPNFQRLIYAIQDKLGSQTIEFASSRISHSSPMEIVAREGKLSVKDAPSNVPPEVVNPIDLDVRLKGVQQTLNNMCMMCSDNRTYQLPHTLHHCLEALKSAATTEPVTWYALEDAKCLLVDCMTDSYAAETWNVVVYKGLSNLIVRIEEIRPLLQPRQIDPETNEAKPPPPEPTIREDQISDVVSIAEDVKSELSSAESQDVLDNNTKQNFESTVEQIAELGASTEPKDKKLFKLRRAMKGLAYLTGGVVTAIGTGVMVNLLTSPSAATTLLARLKPIFESILQFFV
ncbi:ATP-dependent Clp protease ATP-binding subunit ClpA [Roseovarius albus]|uniref:ATP-dependent Clp protease ATP-binding subunit ClpA n=1 Tax=Roseovarius albus TaxID=1247867 RepID=A0A1X6YGV6_9RHOB|nr:ATP-dependent Clp protease ATP-binding subunit ClpA [Roseovarius albus]